MRLRGDARGESLRKIIGQICSRLGGLLSRVGLRVSSEATAVAREQALFVCGELLLRDAESLPVPPPGATGIVFSRDRAMQLHAFLSSWFACAVSPCPLRVLHAASTPEHAESYAELAASWAGRVEFHAETDFRADLLRLVALDTAPRIVFFTDDGMFLDPFDMDEAVRWNPRTHVFSLIHGRALRRCFVLDRDQALPPFRTPPRGGEELLCWKWGDGEPGDWSYPLSLDGHVLGRQELSVLLEHAAFRSPNTLEMALQAWAPLFLVREGLSFPRERLVNIPCNTVQTDCRNKETGLHSADDLLRRWQAGERIEHEVFRGLRCGEAETSSYRFVRR